MTDFTRGLDRRTFIFGAAALGAATLLRPTLAFAEPTSADKFAEADSVRARINEMQEQLTIAGENYYKALDEHEAAVQAVADAQARIDEANAQIAELQDKLSKRARSMYRSGQTTALDVILGATTFEEFATSWDLLNDINDNDAAMVQQTKDLRAEVEAAKIELEKQERIAAEKAEEAARIKAEAEQTIQTLEATLQQLDAEAQALLDQINADAAEVNRQLEAESAAAAEIQKELVAKQKKLEEERKQNNIVLDPGGDYLWPLPGRYKLTSAFGYRIHPITHRPQSHTGIDIPAPGGTPIQASKGGQVVTSAYHSSYGNYVVIDHGNGNSTLYAHMSSRAVSEGQMVSQGQVIGYVGTTGSSTGNHLHLEIRVNYTRTDPEKCFPGLYNSFVRAYNW